MNKLKQIFEDLRTLLVSFFRERGKEEAPVKTSKRRSADSNRIRKVIYSLIGEEKYRIATQTRDTLGGDVHLFEIFNTNGYTTYGDIFDALKKEYREDIESGRLLAITSAKGIIKKDGKYYVGGKEVFPFPIPSFLQSGSEDAICGLMPYDEYVKVKQSNVADGEDESLNTSLKEEDVEELPFTFKEVVADAMAVEASDIHFIYDSAGQYYRISFDIHGHLTPQDKFLLDHRKGQIFLSVIMNSAAEFTKGKFNADLRTIPQDARIVYNDLGVDIRIAFLPEGNMSGRMSFAARLLLKKKTAVTDPANDLLNSGYPKEFIEKADRLARLQNGLFLVSGETGSGKSTFLSKLVAMIPENRRIFTFEDPIEYPIPRNNTTQHQIWEPPKDADSKNHRQASWLEYAKGLKRSAPKAAYFSEIRNDPALIKALIELTNAGLPVFSTIHTSSAFLNYSALTNIYGMREMEVVQLLRLSMNQVLVPKLCDHCKVEDVEGININSLRASLDNDEFMSAHLDELKGFVDQEVHEKTHIHNPDGCQHCNPYGSPGYLGRVPVYEFFVPNLAFKKWYTERMEKGSPPAHEVEEAVYQLGIGKNKIDNYLDHLRAGRVDASPDTIDPLK